jgi:hypothetical protein
VKTLSLTLLALAAAGCATVQPSRALISAEDHQRFGLSPTSIAPWEDGLRTDGAPGTYEWWYFDAHLDDGSTLVIVFFTKPITGTSGPLAPAVQLDLTRPDGSKLTKTMAFDAANFSASKDRCDVKIGPHRFEGDLHAYSLHVEFPELSADLKLEGDVKPWRPAAGVLGFGEKDEKYFAWLPAVPHGKVSGEVTIDGQRAEVSGSGYHDHNWGNAALTELIHDWYWGRARVGDYTIIASFITAEQRYSSTKFPILLLAKGDKVLVGDSTYVTFSNDETATDEKTGKPVSSRLVWDVNDGPKRYRISFLRKKDLMRAPLIDGLPGFTRFLARLAGFDGAYLRFTGDVTVEAFEGDARVDAQTNSTAVWELMYLGHAP